MVYAVAILLVSSLTSVGLLAIWAATSSAHWFWRTMGFLGALAPVLLIPAYEPFVAFVLQGAVVAGGVQLVNCRAARKRGEPFFRSRFSLRTILLAMVPVAVLVAVGVRAPVLNLEAWQSFILIGMVGGVASLIGCWIAFGQSDNWKVRSLLAILLVSPVSLAVACGDWFIYCMDGYTGWPPSIEYLGMLNPYGSYDEGAPVLIWTPIMISVLVLTGMYCAILHFFTGTISATKATRLKYVLGTMIFLAIASPALAVYCVLMNPLPIPPNHISEPNGYADFTAARELLPANPLVNSGNFDTETATVQELQLVSDEMEQALNRVRNGIEMPVCIELEYTSDDLPEISDFRTMTRGFDAKGKLAEVKGNFDQAADCYFDAAKFGSLLGRGGLMIDDLVGIACTGIGCHGLFDCRDRVSIAKIPELLSDLERMETARDNFDEVIYRDRVWGQRSSGWYGHLMDVMIVFQKNDLGSSDGYLQARKRELAVLRLLRIEFALRLWKAKHQQWPASLDLLVPKFVKAIPVDPLSPDEKLLQYARINDDFILYSVGYNEIDEAGKAGDDDGYGGFDPFTGDLRLDILYEPDANLPSGAVTQPDDEQSDAETAEP